MCLDVFLHIEAHIKVGLMCRRLSPLLGLDWLIPFPMLGKFKTIISSKIFSVPFVLSSSSGITISQMLVYLILSQMFLRLCSIIFILFPLFYSSAVISTILPSSSLIRSFASVILLLVFFQSIFNFSNCVINLFAYSLFLLCPWWLY